MAGLPYFQQLLAQNPALANNPAFLHAIQGAGQPGTAGQQTQAQQPFSTSNHPTNTDPASVTGNPQQIAGLAPKPIQDFGGTPQVAPTYADPNQNPAYINAYEQLTQQSLEPYFQQQQMQLQESDAARGIQNTGAAGYLQGNLLGQQGATLAGAYAPIVQQGYGYTQQDIQGNQQAANQAATQNAGYYNADRTSNYDAYNQYLQNLYGSGANQQNSLLTAYLNSFGANSGVSNVASQGLAGTQNAYSNTLGNAQQQASQNAQTAAAAFGGG